MTIMRLIAKGTCTTIGAALAVEAIRFARFEKSDFHTFRSALYQFVLFDMMRFAGRVARRKHDEDCKNFAAVQLEVLKERLQKNKDTAYGREHKFAELLSSHDVLSAYRTGHPLCKYPHFEPWIQRIANGEEKVLNDEKETQLAATSGTSGMRALLPNTPTMAKTFFARGILVIFNTMSQSVPGSFQLQKTCKLAFAPTWSSSPGGLKVGPNSSGPKDKTFAKLLPLYSTTAAGYEIDHDEGAAMYVHALFAIRDRNLGILEANFVSLPARLLYLMKKDGHQFADDVEKGKLNESVAARLDPELVKRIEADLGPPNPQRADEIRKALTSEDDLSDSFALRVWPKLRLILANATGAFKEQAEQLRTGIAKGVPILSTVYAASEGLLGISLDPNLDGSSTYCLVPRAMFFEFLPIDEEAQASEKPLLADELEVGKSYELVITNLGGLYRYRLGDVVKLTGYHHDAPLVEFQYRQGQLLNLRGEKTSEVQLASAMGQVWPADSGKLVEYTTVEQTGSEALRYLVLVELAEGEKLLSDVHDKVDNALRAANPVYDTWRRKGAIATCEVKQVQTGGFERLRKQRLEEGASPQQLKISRVLRKPEHVGILLGS